MRVPTVQWRAVLLPAGVAIGAILVLAWYNFLWIPAQQRYLNERNLRVLRTISAQIKSKVDNFDQAIDNAIDSTENPDKESLGAYVQLFAPDLEILQFAKDGPKGSPGAAELSSGAERLLFEQASDPPRVALQHDEGTVFLYIGYYHSKTRVVARANIRDVAAAYLPVQKDFDALLLVDRDGRVIVQQSSMGVELARIDRLVARAPAAPASASAAGESNTWTSKTTNGAEAENSFQSLRVVTSIADVILGDASFRLYIQPIQLSLLGMPQGTPAEPAKGKSPQRTSVQDEPEEWALCGLVRADHFTSASSTISYTAPLLFVALLACVCLGVPLLKLHILHPRERLRRSDGVWVSVATFLLTALVTFAVLDAYQFLFVVGASTDDQLRNTANEIAKSLSDEVTRIDLQMKELQKELQEAPAWQPKTLKDHRDNRRSHRDEPGEGPRDLPKILTGGEVPRCDPPWACREALLAKLEGEGVPTYPYFDLNSWNDRDGRQRIKWTTGRRVTPFLDMAAANLPDFQTMKRARLLMDSKAPAQQSGVSVLQSPNTGNKITVFWKALARLDSPDRQDEPEGDLIGQSMSMADPISLDQPVLPGGLQFAVLESSGRVLFHTDHTRNLHENFIQECEDSLPLRAKIFGRRDGFLTTFYRARSHRLYIRPLKLEGFGDPGWSLIVFQDAVIPQTVNLYELAFGALMFAIYAATLAGVWMALCLCTPRKESKWFWPDPRKGRRYRAVAFVHAIVALLVIAGVYWFGSTGLVVWTALLTVGALLATYAIVMGPLLPLVVSPGWHFDFLRARTSLLLVTAAVPAIVCFHVSSDFETRLLVKRGQLRLAMDLESRRERIQKRIAQLPLCDSGDSVGQSCARVNSYIEKLQTDDKSLDVHLKPFFVTREQPASPYDGTAGTPNIAADAPDWLEAFLRWAHLPVNDVAVELAAVGSSDGVSEKPGWRWNGHQAATVVMTNASSPSADGQVLSSDLPATGVNGWLVSAIAALVLALYALLRYVVAPLYALDLYAPQGLNESWAISRQSNVLLIGPPGSGKTSRLKSWPDVWMFDLRNARKRAPAAVASLVGAQFGGPPFTSPLAASAGAFDSWGSAFEDVALPSNPRTIIAVDHFEHRLDDADFRDHLLRFLEGLVYRDQRTVWMASDRGPLELLQEMRGPGEADRNELERWERVFQSFRQDVVGLIDEANPPEQQRLQSLLAHSVPQMQAAVSEILREEHALTPPLLTILEDVSARFPTPEAVTPQDVRREMRNAAEPYYRELWSACSTTEKVALRQLADEGVANPTNRSVIHHLMRIGLVVRDPACRIMNRTFEQFVMHAESPDRIAAWEREGVMLPWGSIRTTLLTIALGLGGLLILTQAQLVGAWIGLVPTLAPAVPAVLKIVNSAQRVSKPQAAA